MQFEKGDREGGKTCGRPAATAPGIFAGQGDEGGKRRKVGLDIGLRKEKSGGTRRILQASIGSPALRRWVLRRRRANSFAASKRKPNKGHSKSKFPGSCGAKGRERTV